MKNKTRIIETIRLENGLKVDLDEGWRKLISRQFGGDAGRAALSELISNLIDSYAPHIPWQERRGEIQTTPTSIEVTDHGQGMDTNRLKLLTTMGGTDKDGINSIGRFGMGFFAVMSDSLGTQKVTITSRCEAQFIQLVFNIKAPGKRPEISTKILKKQYDFSTRILVEFREGFNAVKRCLNHAELVLKYLPAHIEINGKLYPSAWEKAKLNQAYLFEKGPYKGFVEKNNWGNNITILSKFEYIRTTPFPYSLSTRLGLIKNDLRDFAAKRCRLFPAAILPSMQTTSMLPSLEIES